jgi:hypothetical protein
MGARSGDSPVIVDIKGSPNPDGQANFAAALPVPLWKATYRLRAGGPSDPYGVLQGWAVVENATASDWSGSAQSGSYTSRSLTSFSVSDGFAKIGIINRTTIVLTLAGAAAATGEATKVVVEIPRTPGTTVHPEGTALSDQTASSWRFATTVIPNASNTLNINIDSKNLEEVQVADATDTLLNLASAAGGLPASALAALAPMVALKKTAVARDQDAQTLMQHRTDDFANDQRLRQNMQQFPAGDPQRSRYVLDLQKSDDQIGIHRCADCPSTRRRRRS